MARNAAGIRKAPQVIAGSLLFGSAAGDKVTITGAGDFIGTGDITVCVWAKVRSLGGNGSGRVMQGPKILMEVDANNRWAFISDGSTIARSANQSLRFNKYQFVVVTRTAAGLTNFFLDSVASGTANQSSGTPTTAAGDYTFGNFSAGTRNFDGNLTQFRVFSGILTQAQITALYQMGLNGTEPFAANKLIEYLMTDGSGSTLTDSSGNGRDGTITTAVWSTEVPQNAGARTLASVRRVKIRDMGTSLFSDGTTSNKVTVANVPLYNLAGTGFTLAFRAKRTETTLTSKRLVNRRSASTGFLVQTRTDDLEAGIGTGGGLTPITFGATGGLTLKWNHYVVSYDLSRQQNYLNGAATNGGARVMVDATTTALTFLNDTGTNALAGYMDEIRLWNRALSATEISNYYYEGTVPLGLIGEWLFNEGSGSSALDTSGYGNNGVISGPTYSSDVAMVSRTLIP